MFEVSLALNRATGNSLVIIDEFGKGTITVMSTFIISISDVVCRKLAFHYSLLASITGFVAANLIVHI